MSRLGFLVIHGMGSQVSGFADGFIAEVAMRLGASAARVVWQPIFWADALEARENALWASMKRAAEPDGAAIPLDWQTLREFVVHNFGDATAYHFDRSPRNASAIVHGIISQAIDRLTAALADPAAPVVVCAHSLGGHMMSNYIWDRQRKGTSADPLTALPTLVGMITFGCNIPLFSLTYETPEPIDLPGDGITAPPLVEAARWLNFLDANDILGWPIRPLYARNLAGLGERKRQTVDRIEDRAIRVGNVLKSWNPASHDGYWNDDDFTGPVAVYLGRLLAAMDGQNVIGFSAP
jgi:hypothetical protein